MGSRKRGGRASDPRLLLERAACSAGPDPAPHAEYFTGFEVSDNYASAYVGGGYAFGKAGLWGPGFRVRAGGAYGPYHYDGVLRMGGEDRPTRFDGEGAYLAALFGYQFEPGRMILKLFAGIEAETAHRSARSEQFGAGSALGLRLQAESWLELSGRLFLSVDAAYGTAFREYWSLVRSATASGRACRGLEGGALGNEEYDAGRGGGFMRVNFRSFETTLSGGFTGNYMEDNPSFYLALGLYRPF